jgi:tRNA-dihydrouridine synthase
VSVKIRIGYRQIATLTWARFILSNEIEALTVHGRTVKELSKVPCHWDEIASIVRLRNEMNVKTMIIGNGDIDSLSDADEKIREYGVDGVMIGRGVFHNPWLFNREHLYENITQKERFQLLIRHLDIYDQLNGSAGAKTFSPLKKYFKIYIQNFNGAAELRDSLMNCSTSEEVRAIISTYL